MPQKQYSNIILFDGVCNLCNNFVQFIIKHDAKATFKFASLQSATAANILANCNYKMLDINSVLLVKNNFVYTKSTAALHIAKELNGAYKIFFVFIIIPKFIRDFVYDIVAKNRYKWFGKKDFCMMPSKELQARFIL